MTKPKLEFFTEFNVTSDACLVGSNAPLKEVRELLNVLQLHETKGVFGVIYWCNSKNGASFTNPQARFKMMPVDL